MDQHGCTPRKVKSVVLVPREPVCKAGFSVHFAEILVFVFGHSNGHCLALSAGNLLRRFRNVFQLHQF